MLVLRSIRNPRDQEASFKQLMQTDVDGATWLVSDLKSKLDLSRRLLQSKSLVVGDAVLRASELWKKLLSRTRPDLQIVSREFAITLIADRLSESKDREWSKTPGAAQVAFDYLSQLMPVLAHPNGEEVMQVWFEAHAESAHRWQRWHTLSHELWTWFLQQGFIAAPWASGVLVNETDLGKFWQRPLVVDLGADLTQVEADIFIQLSDFFDVTVLCPEPSWKSEFNRALGAYEILKKKVGARHENGAVDAEIKEGAREFRKFTTMIAEVKDATAQVRQWLDHDGLSPRDIAIVAPDIEAYWISLAQYLEQEGIPVQKHNVRRLHAYLDISRWLSNLRLRTGSSNEADVELAVFDSDGDLRHLISFERFRTLYARIYGREDFARSEKINEQFAIDLRMQSTDRVFRDEFVRWSLRFVPAQTDFARVELALKKLLEGCPETMSLPMSRWLSYLEQLVSRIECRVTDGDPDGVAALNLTSAESSPVQKMIVLGLTESALRESRGTAILLSDIQSLEGEFGFRLSSEDQMKLEYELRWMSEDPKRDLLFCVPETDFEGSAQAPSWFWVRGAMTGGQEVEVSLPRISRWDELQLSGFADASRERSMTSLASEYLQTSFEQDLARIELAPFAAHSIQRLSPSAIEDYLHCPFVFAAKYVFRQSDDAELDLEVDPSRRGSLMHKLFELLTVEPVRFDLNDVELDLIVEQAREKSKIELADTRLWIPLKARHKELARRFLAFEKEYRTQFPEVKTIAREFEIAGYVNPETGELMRDPTPGALKFSGRIDRIDQDSSGNLTIFDYKSSGGAAKQFGKWIEDNSIQLMLYAMAIENGLTELSPRPVLSAFYYIARPMSRDTGFKVEGVAQGLFESGGRKKNRITTDEKKELFSLAQTLIKKAGDGIAAGRFAPHPLDRKDCLTCRWSALCRAPHLNI